MRLTGARLSSTTENLCSLSHTSSGRIHEPFLLTTNVRVNRNIRSTLSLSINLVMEDKNVGMKEIGKNEIYTMTMAKRHEMRHTNVTFNHLLDDLIDNCRIF